MPRVPILSGTADGCNRLRELLSTGSEPAGRVPAGNKTVTRQSHERAGEDGQATVKSDDTFV